MSDTEYEPSDNSNLSFQVGTDILNLLGVFFLTFFYPFLCIVFANIWWRNIFITSFKIVLSIRLSNSLWESDVLLFSEFVSIGSILYYDFIKFITSLNTFLVFSFALSKKCIIRPISFSNFSDVLSAFTCARAVGNLWRICLGVNILRCKAKSEVRPVTSIGTKGNISHLKTLRTCHQKVHVSFKIHNFNEQISLMFISMI